MGYPTVEVKLTGGWTLDGGAKFEHVVAGQTWKLHLGPYDWVTVAQAAVLLGVSPQAVSSWASRGQLDDNALGHVGGVLMLHLPYVRWLWENRDR